MKGLALSLCLILGSFSLTAIADEPQSETERWRKIVSQLQIENRALRQQSAEFGRGKSFCCWGRDAQAISTGLEAFGSCSERVDN